MDPSLSELCAYWQMPARFVLVQNRPHSARSEDPFIADAKSLSRAYLTLPDDLRAEVVARMRQAGVVTLSHDAYLAALRLPHEIRRLPQRILICEPTLRLVRLEDGRFQIITAGSTAPLYTGHEHILCSKPLAQLLTHNAPGDISTRPAVIFDPVTHEHFESHAELVLRSEITPETLSARAWPPSRAWHFRKEALFVDADLRDQLVQEGVPVDFLPGFQSYA